MSSKPTLLMLVPRNYAKSTEMIMEEAKKVFNLIVAPIEDIVIDVDTKNLKIEYQGKDLTKVDYVLSKIDSKHAVYGFQVINAFDSFKIPKPYHAATVLIAHDKFLTTIILARQNIPVPRTYLLKTKNAVEEILDEISYPVTVKLRSGYGGKGIMFVENRKAMESLISSMEVLKQEVLVQEFIKNPGEDLRVLVAEDKIIGSMKRVAANGEQRANIKVGGKAVRYEATDDIKELAIKTAKAVGAKICAVDIIEGSEGPVVIEVNINPGIQGLTQATDANIAKKIVDYIYEKVEEREKIEVL